MINPGNYKARAIEGALGFSDNGKEQVAILFEILEGEYAGQTLTWRGYFTDKTEDRTLESLMIAGWDGEDLGLLVGLGSTECTIVVKHEEYEGKTQVRVAWVNRLGGSLAMKNKMTEAQQASFAQRMRGRAASIKQKMKSRGDDASFDFGANADLPPGVSR